MTNKTDFEAAAQQLKQAKKNVDATLVRYRTALAEANRIRDKELMKALADEREANAVFEAALKSA